jgi:glycosyltransferase involved in cell wall biosynthesis
VLSVDSSLDKWAVVGVKDDTGSGRASRDLTRLLFPARHIVTPSYRIEGHAIGERDIFVGNDAEDEQIEMALNGLEVLILLEDQPIHHRIVRAAKSRGIKVHLIALWEWFSWYLPIRRLYDTIICPNQFCRTIIKKFGFNNTVLLNWPVDLESLPKRSISGPARLFVHNAGKFERDDRKSTLATLEAFHRVKDANISLVLRSQNSLPWVIEDRRIRYSVGNLPDYSDLYSEGDVFIQPSKAEGIGLSILEALACGLPVLTTDYPPMNEYVTDSRMLVGTYWGKRPAHQSTYIPQAHLKIPRIDRLAERIQWCAKTPMDISSSRNRKWALESFEPGNLRMEWLRALCR